jgi:CRISPR/Cas system-associated protein Cas7 (RAMP superfamily)
MSFGFAPGVRGFTKRVDLPMDLSKMIAELQAERHRIDEAIEALERLSAGKARRRGRPPNWLKDEIMRQGSEEPEEPPPAAGKSKKG